MEREICPVPDLGLGTAVLAGLSAIVFGAVVLIVISGNIPHVARNEAPVTVGAAHSVVHSSNGASTKADRRSQFLRRYSGERRPVH